MSFRARLIRSLFCLPVVLDHSTILFIYNFTKHLYRVTFFKHVWIKNSIFFEDEEKNTTKWQGLSVQSEGIGLEKVIYILGYHAVFDLNIFLKFKSFSRDGFNGILWAYQNACTGLLMKISSRKLRIFTNFIFYRMRSKGRDRDRGTITHMFSRNRSMLIISVFMGGKNKILLMMIIIDMGFVMCRKGLVSTSFFFTRQTLLFMGLVPS